MKPFAAPLDDILFSLRHVAEAEKLPMFDAELTQEIGQHFASFAEAELAPLDESGDQQGCSLIDGRVKMPDGFAAAYREYAEQGWPGLTAPEAFGGQALDDLTLCVTSEIFSGANHSLQMVTGLVPGAVRTLLAHGTPEQQATFIPRLASGQDLATMCLTEPGAGSDLSRIRCKAIEQGDAWLITGEKIFISGGDQDLSQGIQHLVLARTSDDGVKGLSLFLCPSETATGAKNPITVTRIEEKMGLHASPTCQMAFDGAEAQLIGRVGGGLAAMFTMMNHARIDVALQGVAHASRAYDIARSYAAERVQGRKSDRSDAMLIDHADVARMLDDIDMLAVGARAIAHLCIVTLDEGTNPDLVEFLTPIAKVAGSEAGIRAAELGMQVLGGYGYLREYRLEQTYRDARITAIYEGANGIHERALATRHAQGAAGDAFADYIGATDAPAVKRWHSLREKLAKSAHPDTLAHEFANASRDALLSGLWQKIATVADQHPNSERMKRISRIALNRLG